MGWRLTKMFAFFTVVLLSTTCVRSLQAKGPLVKIQQGTVLGSWSKSYKNRAFSAFYGIPYAQPPVGALRFKEPQLPTPWGGTWVANLTQVCTQILQDHDQENGLYWGDEDCLYLNIFVPSTDPTKIKTKLPVLFDIHGGAFMFGYSRSYSGPSYIMDRDVILVTINYRLGALGFLSTGDDVLPGNLGMKDQVAALTWVHKYIQHFGGDPKSVTLTGMSAGGASVHLHYLSPLSRGLFKNGISMSGTALMPWVTQEVPSKKVRALGAACGCNQQSSKDLVMCLKQKPAKQLVQQSQMFRPWLFNPFSPFALVVEKNNPAAFLPDHPYNLLKEGKVADVSWIATLTEDEGLYPAAGFLNKPNYLPDLEANWTTYCPFVFDFNYTIPLDKQAYICSLIKQFYIQDRNISKATFPQLVKAMSDRLFKTGGEKSAQMQAIANKSPVYLYLYKYRAEKQQSFIELFSTSTTKQGISHGDDIVMIFSNKNKPLVKMTPNDEKMKDMLLDFFLSFAKTGKPKAGKTVWSPVDRKMSEISFLQIDSPKSVKMHTNKTISNAFFWNNLAFKENENL